MRHGIHATGSVVAIKIRAQVGWCAVIEAPLATEESFCFVEKCSDWRGDMPAVGARFRGLERAIAFRPPASWATSMRCSSSSIWGGA
jgi:hypothetical protein